MNRTLKKVKNKNCKICQREFKPFKSTDRYCSLQCAYKGQKDLIVKPQKPIRSRSAKMQKADREYYRLRKEFLSKPENKICFVDGCNKRANTVEHQKGRLGDNYLNAEYWKPCCLFHNLEFERNTELSNKYQLSRFHDGKKIVK